MIDEIINDLEQLPRFGKTGGLPETKRRLALLGHPEKKFRYIHVAGTNGKGSVCAYLESCLRNFGFKTGLFTSPHLIRMNERIKINQSDISDEAFEAAFYTVKTLADAQQLQGIPYPTFSEFMYLMAMVAFEKENIEFGVIETGLGGRFDFTNAIDAPCLTVITSIGLDHTAVLGDSIEAIAAEKAGIIKTKTPLVFLEHHQGAAAVIRNIAKENHVDEKLIYPVFDDWMTHPVISEGKISFSLECPYFDKYDIMLNTRGLYQIRNAALAVTALEVIRTMEDWEFDSRFDRRIVQNSLYEMQWPGRMEAVAPDIYIDGAHNDDGICALAASVNQAFADEDVYLVFAVAEDKDYIRMIQHICNIKNLKGIIVTEIDHQRRRNYHQVLTQFQENWHGKLFGTYNVNEAIETGKAWKKDHGILLCTGSLYLAGHVKKILGGM